MNFKKFKNILELYKNIFYNFNKLDNLGFNFYENEQFPLVEDFEKIITLFFQNLFTDEGVEWIFWFIYENDYGNAKPAENHLPKGYNAFILVDNKKQYICYDYKSLYNHLKKENYIKCKI